MKVLNLRCAQDHRFEGWFGSDDDFRTQGERGLVACPICNDKAISRLPSAPRLNVSTQRGEAGTPTAGEIAEARAQGRWLQAVRELINKTEDVGDRFPEEARRIHYGEGEERGIRGQASTEETQALLEEGIGVLPLSVPKALKEPLQ